jgi:hypothetical protein
MWMSESDDYLKTISLFVSLGDQVEDPNKLAKIIGKQIGYHGLSSITIMMISLFRPILWASSSSKYLFCLLQLENDLDSILIYIEEICQLIKYDKGKTPILILDGITDATYIPLLKATAKTWVNKGICQVIFVGTEGKAKRHFVAGPENYNLKIVHFEALPPNDGLKIAENIFKWWDLKEPHKKWMRDKFEKCLQIFIPTYVGK